jgi:hypothetical protein
MQPDWEAELENFTDGMMHDILDSESANIQFFDDLCDGQRDSYMDQLQES